MDNLLNKLKHWIKVIQTAIIGTIIVEAILVIIIGIASNKIDESQWTGILIGCGVTYLFILTIKTAYHLKFPGSIIEELQAKRQLEIKEKLFDRQKAINEYITKTIQGLNKQTCYIDIPEDVGHLCDKELQVRLTELLEPIVSYTDVILDTSAEKKFTIGIHLDSYQKFPNDYSDIKIIMVDEAPSIQDWSPISDSGILILRDELELSEILPKGLVSIDKINGAQYEIQTAIKRTLNNLTFNSHDFKYKDNSYTIICSEILEVCSDDYVNGVLFIIFRQGISFPADVPEVLRIFNRVTSNYVSKYNSCITDQIAYKLRIQEMKSV